LLVSNLDVVYDEEPKELIKVDLGCGKRKQDGHIGIDRIDFEGVDHVLDMATDRLPFGDDEVDEVYTSHFMEHLDSVERCHVMNEIHRVLKTGGKCTFIVPYWASSRAYGDPTHKWPPIGEMWFFYLNQEWRDENAPHTDSKYWDKGYNCDFDITWGYALHQQLQTRSQDYVQHALTFWKEAGQDIQATLTKK
jgi:SAM-dependent methyltransferase